jgi:hypothetical protein
MVNGLGGTPISELYLLYGYAHEQLAQRGINVRRNYIGNYCTSLDMAGTSITLSRLDPDVDALLDAPAEIAIRTFCPDSELSPSGAARPGWRGCLRHLRPTAKTFLVRDGTLMTWVSVNSFGGVI